MFVGRSRELQVLDRKLSRSTPSLVVIYGRRRVGKSTLILRALEGRPHVYYQATRVTDPDSQELLKQQAARALGGDPVLAGLTGWEAIFSYFQRLAETSHPGLTLVLDEFPYLCEANRALPLIVQKVWDEVRGARTPLNLILCGSAIAFMEDLLAERNPLHGRQSAKLDVGALSYREAAEFFPRWDPEEQLRAYGVFGGMPYYLSLCDPDRTLAENVQAVILVDGAPAPGGATERLPLRQHPARGGGRVHEAAGDPEPGALQGRIRDRPHALLPQAGGAPPAPHRGVARRMGPGSQPQRSVLPR
jgi:AAA+ ATPase superfamily predicted ATPase